MDEHTNIYTVIHTLTPGSHDEPEPRNVTEYVRFDIKTPLTSEQKTGFQKALNAAKEKLGRNADTFDIVEHALLTFLETHGVYRELCEPFFDAVFVI